jgi:hypothetical protein
LRDYHDCSDCGYRGKPMIRRLLMASRKTVMETSIPIARERIWRNGRRGNSEVKGRV